jgi:signal transduction histidine kinase
MLAPARRTGRRGVGQTAVPLFAVGVVLLAAGFYGAWRVHRLYQRGSDILSENVASIRAAEEFDTIARELRYRLKRYLSGGSKRHLEQAGEIVSAEAPAALDEVEALAKTRREQDLARQMRLGYKQLEAEFARIAALPAATPRDQILLALADEVITNELLVYIARYIQLNEQELDRSNRRVQSSANRLTFGLVLLGVCGGVAGLLAGYGIARLVNRTIVQLAIPLRDAAGKLSQVAGPVSVVAEPGFDDLESILQCVSDRVTTIVERLQESERDRLRTEQLAALGQLAAGLAHELRNPLTSMKAILQLSTEPTGLSHRDLDVLREECDRLEHSVQSLLDFARPPQVQKSPTNVGALVEQTAALTQRRAQRQGIALTCDSYSSSARLLADAAQLRQLVLNLLLNALDVTPHGGEVRIDCWLEDIPADPLRQRTEEGERRARVVIRVSDSGSGLPEHLGQQIFEPFVTTKETGAGLGLSICQQIIAVHGGELTAANRQPRGASFEARLPLVLVEQPPAEARLGAPACGQV